MQQPNPRKKCWLSPSSWRLPVLNSSTKAVEVEKAVSAPSVPTRGRTGKQLSPNGPKKRPNQHSLVRRRKISVSEIGPMTTAQELAMDSPTVPGRPSPHERSISAPGTSFRKHQLTNTCFHIPRDDGGPEPRSTYLQGIAPTSPKHFAPVIPHSDAPLPLLRHQRSLNYFPAANDYLRHDRFDGSPRSRMAFTPNTTPKSTSINATSCDTLPTPVLAPPMEPRTASPKPWNGRYIPPITMEASIGFRGRRKASSESSGFIDRGRPRKRSDLCTSNYPVIQWPEPKRGKSVEQKASEQLPTGLKQADAFKQLEQSEISLLQRQAFDQVGRFEVLKAADVEALSKELRHLDERAKYLRRIYSALRVGRRNLHSRILQYLRSRAAKFSHESTMKLEEALGELDASIDDWMNKLEQVENRRTRVCQKLLEHVAAAACLAVGGLTTTPEPLQQPRTSTPTSGIGNISGPLRNLGNQANRAGASRKGELRSLLAKS